MNRDQFYEQLPRIGKRLFTWGILSAAVFLTLWYIGGFNLWGRFLELCLKVVTLGKDISFAPGNSETAAFVYKFGLEDGRQASLTFPVNRLNSSMVEVVTLLAVWPYRGRSDFFKLVAWCLLFTVLYQCFNVWIQLYDVKIGPQFAGSYGIFWEDTLGYRIVAKVAAFDKFILRYWAGFPIFLCALVAFYFSQQKQAKRKSGRGKGRK